MDHSSQTVEIRARLADITGAEPAAAEHALLARLIHSFLGKTPPAVDRLDELLRGDDPVLVRDHAHGLKGSAANLGAGTLAAIFAEIEQDARNGRVADADLTVTRVRSELGQVTGVLLRLADELDQPVARSSQ